MTIYGIYEKYGSAQATLKITSGEVKDALTVLQDVGPATEVYLHDERYLCRPSAPWDRVRHGLRVCHRGAHEIADFDETRLMKCRDCGHEWTEELPQ